LAFIVFDSFAERNAWWLRIVCMTGAMIGLAGRSKFELASAGSERIADVVEFSKSYSSPSQSSLRHLLW
jgi:hypothetical protein